MNDFRNERKLYLAEIVAYTNTLFFINSVDLIFLFDKWVSNLDKIEKSSRKDVVEFMISGKHVAEYFYDSNILSIAPYGDELISACSETMTKVKFEKLCISSFNRHFNLSRIKNVWLPK